MELVENKTYKMPIFGKIRTVLVLKIHPFGTIDVQLQNGNCYRLTGLSLYKPSNYP